MGKVIGKKKSNSGGHSKRFLVHRLHHQHRGGHSSGQGGGTHEVRAGKDQIQENSRVGKSGAKKALVGKILAKEKHDAGKILAKKKFLSGLVPIIKKVSARPRSRQGPRQEGRSEPRELYKQGQRQACWTGARKRPDKAASPDREGQRVVPEPSFWTENQQMKAEPNSSKIESSRQQEQKRSSA